MSEIEWLEKWYKLNCNGQWEHLYGVQIETKYNRSRMNWLRQKRGGDYDIWKSVSICYNR